MTTEQKTEFELKVGEVATCSCGQRWIRDQPGRPLRKLDPLPANNMAIEERLAKLERENADLAERLRRVEQRFEDGTVKAGVPAKEWLRMSLDRKVGR